MRQQDTSLQTLGNQGWFKVTWYLIRIGDWPSVLGQLNPATIALLHRQHKRAKAANSNAQD